MQIMENLHTIVLLRCPHQLDRYIHFYFMVYMFATLGLSQRYPSTAVMENKRIWENTKCLFLKKMPRQKNFNIEYTIL